MRLYSRVRRGCSASVVLVGVLTLLALAACNKPVDKPPVVTNLVPTSAAGQRVYLDPQTGKMRAPTAAEKAAAAAAEKQQQQTDGSQQKAQLETRDREEKIPGGGSIIRLGPQDWPQEKIKLDATQQGDAQP